MPYTGGHRRIVVYGAIAKALFNIGDPASPLFESELRIRDFVRQQPGC